MKIENFIAAGNVCSNLTAILVKAGIITFAIGLGCNLVVDFKERKILKEKLQNQNQ